MTSVLNIHYQMNDRMFFVFDGVDGAGKSTQLESFVDWLREQGREVVTCQDPGSSELGEKLRAVLLGKHEIPISMRAEMMMFTTARTQLVEEVVRPALAAGKVVVLDRYVYSTIVYQGHAGQLDPDELWTVNRIATEGLMPNVTFILDLPIEKAMKRLGDSLDRMESRGSEYFEKVRAGFIAESERWPTGVELIDADRDMKSIQNEIREIAAAYIERNSAT